jgi:hypothetical protein
MKLLKEIADKPVTRRKAIKYTVMAGLAVIVPLVTDGTDSSVKQAEAGAGRCSLCQCPQYYGNGDVCTNCGHNYYSHW